MRFWVVLVTVTPEALMVILRKPNSLVSLL
jgi:hypothetical protein